MNQPLFGQVLTGAYELTVSHVSCSTPGRLTLAISVGTDGSSFVPRLPAWSLLSRLRSGEGAPSLFSSLLRSDEPGAPPPTAAEVAQASRSHFRRAISARHLEPPVSGSLPGG